MAADGHLDGKELEELAARARSFAASTDDPSLRAALQLLVEAAENVRIKLPGPAG